MDLSADVLDGLQILGDSALIPDKTFPVLLENSCECLLKSKQDNFMADNPAYASVDAGCVKQAHGALLTFLLEAAKHDKDPSSLSHVLEDSKFTPDRIQAVEKAYTENRSKIRLLLSNSGSSLPHIVDSTWRLDYCIKDNERENVKEPSFLIQLKTEQSGQSGTEDVQFSCTQEELQDLVSKLRDACKAVERASQM